MKRAFHRLTGLLVIGTALLFGLVLVTLPVTVMFAALAFFVTNIN